MPPHLWIEQVVFPLIAFAILGSALYGVYRTVNRSLERRDAARLGPDGELADAVRRLEQRVEVLEDHALRLQELEERVDFAERMLAKHEQRPLLGDH